MRRLQPVLARVPGDRLHHDGRDRHEEGPGNVAPVADAPGRRRKPEGPSRTGIQTLKSLMTSTEDRPSRRRRIGIAALLLAGAVLGSFAAGFDPARPALSSSAAPAAFA